MPSIPPHYPQLRFWLPLLSWLDVVGCCRENERHRLGEGVLLPRGFLPFCATLLTASAGTYQGLPFPAALWRNPRSLIEACCWQRGEEVRGDQQQWLHFLKQDLSADPDHSWEWNALGNVKKSIVKKIDQASASVCTVCPIIARFCARCTRIALQRSCDGVSDF